MLRKRRFHALTVVKGDCRSCFSVYHSLLGLIRKNFNKINSHDERIDREQTIVHMDSGFYFYEKRCLATSRTKTYCRKVAYIVGCRCYKFTVFSFPF